MRCKPSRDVRTLATACALSVAAPGATGQTAVAPKPTFEVVSVRVNESNERPRFRVNAVPQTGR